MTNPVLAEIIRGQIIESRHRGAFAVVDSAGKIALALGDVETPIYPRSAIKAFQCLPLIESGAAGRFGFTEEEIALCCSSHDGEADHVRVAKSILAKAGNDESQYECGTHWPTGEAARFDLVRAGKKPRAIHNNCSGKHAGMLALAKYLGVASEGYVRAEHPVQQAIAATLNRFCDIDVAGAPCGIDGCSVPTWAYPLKNMALGFARLASSDCQAGNHIITSVRNHPFMVAGSARYDTKIMRAVPRLFIKLGAEGIFCGCIPHAGLGFALKCDDGTYRAAELAAAQMLLKLDVWTADERVALAGFAQNSLKNWSKLETGLARASF